MTTFPRSPAQTKKVFPIYLSHFKEIVFWEFGFYIFSLFYVVVVVVVVKRTRTQIIMMMTEQTSSTGSPVDLRSGAVAGCDGLRLCRFQVRIQILPGARCLYFAGDSSAAGGVHRGVALPRPVNR